VSTVVSLNPNTHSISAEKSDLELCRELLHAHYANGGSYIEDFDQLDTKIFNASEHSYILRQMAKGLSLVEIMDSFNLIWDVLSPADKLFVACHFLQGRSESIQRATTSLFDAMKNGNDTAALSYLSRFAEDWQHSSSTQATPKALEIKLVD